MEIDQQIVYHQLAAEKNAVWSLLLASGYLKAKDFQAYTTEYGEWREIRNCLCNRKTRFI